MRSYRCRGLGASKPHVFPFIKHWHRRQRTQIPFLLLFRLCFGVIRLPLGLHWCVVAPAIFHIADFSGSTRPVMDQPTSARLDSTVLERSQVVQDGNHIFTHTWHSLCSITQVREPCHHLGSKIRLISPIEANMSSDKPLLVQPHDETTLPFCQRGASKAKHSLVSIIRSFVVKKRFSPYTHDLFPALYNSP